MMKQRLTLTGAALLLCVLMTGCGNKVAGSYKLDGHKNTLTLTRDGKFLLNTTGDSGAYTVEGKTIIVTAPMFGGAQGRISGSTLVFPESDSIVGRSFAGTWKKQ